MPRRFQKTTKAWHEFHCGNQRGTIGEKLVKSKGNNALLALRIAVVSQFDSGAGRPYGRGEMTMAKSSVIMVGADKGGVGKTKVARTLLDCFVVHQVPTRAFDTEAPKGTLMRFHPDISEIVDITATSDQMRIFDTISDTSVTVIDVRAGLLSSTLRALRDIGFLDSAKKGQL